MAMVYLTPLDQRVELDLQKTITFKRLPFKHVTGYKVYGEFDDPTYTSGVRRELIDEFDNPAIPDVSEITIDLPYNQNATWQLPYDAYLDRDYTFYITLINGEIEERLGSMFVSFNRITKMITIDTIAKTYDVNSRAKLTYFQDFITKTYSLVDDCKIIVKPVFVEGYTYGFHNIII